jgi:hypothetical protein
MSLEAGLRAGSLNLTALAVEDATTRGTIERTLGGLDFRTLRAGSWPEPGDSPATIAGPDDPVTQTLRDLRSSDAARVRAALSGTPALDPALVPEAIHLLAREEVARDALEALRRVAMSHAGQLVDALIDPGSEFAARRRIPGLLAGCPGALAVEGLIQGLGDPRFEVRYRCGRALTHLADRDPGLPIDHLRIFEVIQREAAGRRDVWDAQSVLDQLDDRAGEDADDEFLRRRAGGTLEHVFSLLSLVLPPEPVRIAYRGLHAGDPILRGTALEYLESVLPRALRDVLWPHLDTHAASRAPRPAGERDAALQNLLSSHKSIEINLERLRKEPPGEDPAEP